MKKERKKEFQSKTIAFCKENFFYSDEIINRN